MNYHWVCNLSKVNTTGVTSGAGTAYSSGISEFIPRFLVRFVLSDLRQVGGFLWVLWFPPRYNRNIVESGTKHHKPTNQPTKVQLLSTGTPVSSTNNYSNLECLPIIL
jgi:hypothetical protein